MRPGQYDDAGHKTHEQQRDDLYPDFDEFGVPYDLTLYDERVLHIVTGVTAACVPASAGAWAPVTSDRNPSPRGSLAPQLPDVEAEAGSRGPGS